MYIVPPSIDLNPPFPIPHRVPNGELVGRIIADNDYTEGIAVGYLSQLLSAVDCLHQLNIAHLDIRVCVFFVI